MLADEAGDADRIREPIHEEGTPAQHPAEKNRKWTSCFSERLHCERNHSERCFSKLAHFRRVATRYGKLAANLLAVIQLVSMRLRLRDYEPMA